MPPQVPTSIPFAFSALPVALTALLIAAFGLRVVLRRFNGATAAFFTLTLAVSVWLAAFTGLYLSSSAEQALYWARTAYLGVPFIAPAIYWFTAELLRIERRRRLIIIASWTYAAVISTLAVTTDNVVPDQADSASGSSRR